jgi:hypothetical protein
MRITGNLRLHTDVTTELIKVKVVPLVSHLPVESCLYLDPAKGSRSQVGMIRRRSTYFRQHTLRHYRSIQKLLRT